MAKFSFYIFTVAVLLGGTAADTACLIDRVMTISPSKFIIDPDSACRDLHTKFDRTRQELEKCLDFKFNIKKLEDLHQEFCNPNSDFRQKVERQRNCINRNAHGIDSCFPVTEIPFDYEHVPERSNYDLCESVTAETSKCMVDKMGRTCGAESFEVYGRIARESESILTAICFSTYLDSARNKGKIHLAEEIEEAEKKFFEISLVQTDQYNTAAMTIPSALIWCILVGLLSPLMW